MTLVSTRLKDEQIQKIEEKGISVYRFLQIAVEEKLSSDDIPREQKIDQESTTELLLDLIQTVTKRLGDIDIGIKNIDSELVKNNEIAKNKLGLIAEILKNRSEG